MSVDARGSITLCMSQFNYKEKHGGGNRLSRLTKRRPLRKSDSLHMGSRSNSLPSVFLL